MCVAGKFIKTLVSLLFSLLFPSSSPAANAIGVSFNVSSEFNHFFLWYTINTNLVQTTLIGCPLYSELISLLFSFLLFSLFATQETK